jgi:hypothetical protein
LTSVTSTTFVGALTGNASTVTNLTLGSATSITGGGTIALGGFTLTVPATGTPALLGTANTFTAAQTNSTAGAASTPSAKWTGVPFAGTGTTSFPLVYINDANATASTTLNTAGTYFGINGDGTQDLMNLLKDGSSMLKLSSTGTLTNTSDIIVNRSGSGTHFAVQTSGSNRIRLADFSGSSSYVSLDQNTAVIQGGTSTDWYISRASAGVTNFGTSSSNALGSIAFANATASGTLAVTGISTLTGGSKLGATVVGSLPSAASNTYLELIVTDSLAPVAGSTVAAGGSAKCKVCSNGTNWIVTATL